MWNAEILQLMLRSIANIQTMDRDRILMLILEIVCQMVGAYIPVQFDVSNQKADVCIQ